MKKINHLISALIMAAMTAGFVSCSSSDEPSSVSDNTPKELTITIKTQGVTTKAAASVNDPGASAENTMNRITTNKMCCQDLLNDRSISLCLTR